MPIWLEWDTFRRKNGGPDFAAMRRQVGNLRGGAQADAHSEADYRIGCIMLSEPVWFAPEQWVAPPADGSANIAQG